LTGLQNVNQASNRPGKKLCSSLTSHFTVPFAFLARRDQNLKAYWTLMMVPLKNEAAQSEKGEVVRGTGNIASSEILDALLAPCQAVHHLSFPSLRIAI
jgi:hypothetical protein